MPYDPSQVTSYYAALFAARTDVYSAWTSAGWRPVRSPLTSQIVLAGLQGTGPSISGYMIAPGSVSHVLAFDFDSDDGLDRAFATSHVMWDSGLYCYVESSRRGGHLWCILGAMMPAIAIRRAARALLAASGLSSEDPKIEIRPGSDTVDARIVDGRVVGDGLGHALRLPLMPHPKTGFRGNFMLPTGLSLTQTSLADMLLSIEYAPTKTVVEWAERWRPKYRVTSEYRMRREYPEDNDTVSHILAELWGVPNPRAGRSVRCPAHDDKVASLNIFPDDKRVMCMAPGCELNNDGHGRGTYELRKLAPQTIHG